MSRNIDPKASLIISDKEKKVNSTDAGKLLLTYIDDIPYAFLVKDNAIDAVCIPFGSKVGQIHLCKVKNVVPQLKACFVEIADNEICFLPMKDSAYAMLRNRIFDGRIKEGDEFPVCICRDAQKKKPAAVTADISVSTGYFAIGQGTGKVRFSAKLSASDKENLSRNLQANGILSGSDINRDYLPAIFESSSIDLIVRTKAAKLLSLDETELLDSVKEVFERAEQLWSKAAHCTCFAKLSEPEEDLIKQLSEWIKPEEYTEIVTDSESIYHSIQNHSDCGSASLRLYQDNLINLSALYGLQEKLQDALETRIWLKSGAFLYIEPTEALTVIDVNSGKYEASRRDDEAYVLKINLEAAKEIARQLRLRNLSGIIVVDFINMKSAENRQLLMDTLTALTARDIITTKVVDMTALGLVEITRKKMLKSLREQLEDYKHKYK